MNKYNKYLRPDLICAFVGLAFFFALAGKIVVDPTSIAWLLDGDRQQSYFGWLFFRHEPWSLPLGQQHALGLEQASSIVYTDSIPLLAFVFKCFSPLLPAQFQYSGIWELFSYGMMGFFSAKLLSTFTKDRLRIVTGSLFFILSPIMALRVNAHIALSSHWIVVAAIYLYYNNASKRPFLGWLILICTAALVHAYLMLIVLCVFTAFCCRKLFIDRDILASALALRIFSMGGTLIALLWLTGYFGDLALNAEGFGYYSLNLAGVVAPVNAAGFLLPTVSGFPGQYEGFDYLGLGILFMGLWTIVERISLNRNPPRPSSPELSKIDVRTDMPLYILCVALTLLAISNIVTLGNHELVKIPIPQKLVGIFNIFRASGRMFWPVYYLIIFWLLRGILNKNNLRTTVILTSALCLQVADVGAFVVQRLSVDTRQKNTLSIHNSLVWDFASRKKRAINVISARPDGADLGSDEKLQFTSLAAEHNLAIDTAYYGRTTSDAAQRPRTSRHLRFLTGQLDPSVIYVISTDFVSSVLRMQEIWPANTGIGFSDNYLVVVPNWFTQANARELALLSHPSAETKPELLPGHRYTVTAKSGEDKYLGTGWTEPGDRGVWSEGSLATIGFHIPSCHGQYQLHFSLLPYMPTGTAAQPLDISFSNQKRLILTKTLFHAESDLGIDISQSDAAQCNFLLSLKIANPRSPKELGQSEDPKKLGVLLQSFEVKEATTSAQI